jgi:hypothetical protein
MREGTWEGESSKGGGICCSTRSSVVENKGREEVVDEEGVLHDIHSLYHL